MAALAASQVPGGAAAAAIGRPSPPLRYTLMSGLPQRPGPGSRKAAGKMAAVSAPYAKYPPPPPLRPPGGKGKRVGFTPPPPPAQTPSSLSVSASRARQHRSLRPRGQQTALSGTGRAATPGDPRPSPAQWRCVPGSAGRPAARPAPAYNSGASEPLSAPPGAALPAAARGVSRAGPRCRLPAPAPRPQRQKPNRAASILKKEYLYLRNWRHTCPSGDPGPGGPVLGGGAQRGPPSPRAGGGGAGVPGLRGGRVSVTGPRGGVVFCFVCRAPGKGQSS